MEQSKAQKFEDWRQWIEAFVINDIRKALDNDILEVSLIILTLIGTECLSGYFVGGNADKESFISFLKKYFPTSYSDFAELIYACLRNGLAHDYVIKVDEKLGLHPFIMKRYGYECAHLQPCILGQDFPVWFNRETFARDFLEAWGKYLSDLRTNDELYENMLSRVGTRGYLLVGDFLHGVSGKPNL